jgi:hypothetical protein
MKPSLKTLIISLLIASSASAEKISITAADSVVDFIGINTQFGAINTPYVQNFAAPVAQNNVKAILNDLGVRHARDSFPRANTNLPLRSNFAELYRDFGVNFLQVVDGRTKATVDGKQVEVLDQGVIPLTLNDIESGVVTLGGINFSLREMIDAIEGPKEYDVNPDPTRRDPNWAQNLRSFQTNLYNSTRIRSALNQIRVAGPLLSNITNCTKLGSIATSLDLGNLRTYPLLNYWQRPLFNLPFYINEGKVCHGIKKVWVSETGYRSGEDGITERSIAKYLSRLPLEYFLQGDIQRTYLFSLVDPSPGPELAFGLIESTSTGQMVNGALQYNLRPRAQFFALRSLINLLREGIWVPANRSWQVPQVTPSVVDIVFGERGSDTRHFLVKKSNNEHLLFLWRDVEVFNPTAGNINNVPDAMTVTLPNDFKFQATLAFNSGFTFDEVKVTPTSSMTVNVPDQLIVLKFSKETVVTNVAPKAENDSFTVNAGEAFIIPVLGNDTDPDKGPSPLKVIEVSGASKGEVFIQADNTIRYAARANTLGSDSFTYTITDGALRASATVNVIIREKPIVVSNVGPIAVGDTATVNAGEAVVIPILANDSDPDRGPSPIGIVEVSRAAKGDVVLLADKTLRYSARSDASGIDSFTYTITDGNARATGTVTVTVRGKVATPPNRPPTTVPDRVYAKPGRKAVFNPINNDTDPDTANSALTLVEVTKPKKGSLRFRPDGFITYLPKRTSKGSEKLVYRISDGTNSVLGNIDIRIVKSTPKKR